MMKKSTAIRVASKNFPNVLSNSNTRFANSNSKLNIWWFDIPPHTRLRNTYINLLMYDQKCQTLYYLEVESKFLSDNHSAVYVRPDNEAITLYLSTSQINQFRDLHASHIYTKIPE